MKYELKKFEIEDFETHRIESDIYPDRFLIIGSRKSGRSTAILNLVNSRSDLDKVVIISPLNHVYRDGLSLREQATVTIYDEYFEIIFDQLWAWTRANDNKNEKIAIVIDHSDDKLKHIFTSQSLTNLLQQENVSLYVADSTSSGVYDPNSFMTVLLFETYNNANRKILYDNFANGKYSFLEFNQVMDQLESYECAVIYNNVIFLKWKDSVGWYRTQHDLEYREVIPKFVDIEEEVNSSDSEEEQDEEKKSLGWLQWAYSKLQQFNLGFFEPDFYDNVLQT